MPPEQDPRVYFAAERTLLAWIRTGLGLMGIGFAVSRFGLFLREIAATPAAHAPIPRHNLSTPSGVALVGLGILVNVAAVHSHIQLTRELREGSWQPGKVSRNAVILGLILAVVGIAMAIYLILIR